MKRRRLLLAVIALLMFVGVVSGLAGCIRGGERIAVNGMSRRYRVHVPANLDQKAPAPLVLALHQFSDTDKGMEELTDFNDLADAEGFIVAYPQGRWRVWNNTGQAGADDLAFLNALIDRLSSEYAVDPGRIYATGASAGGMMVQYFACQKNNRLAAIAPVMGSLDHSAACASDTPMPVIIIHGTADPVVPYKGGNTSAGPGRTINFMSAEEDAAFWAKHNGCSEPPAVEDLPDANPADKFSVKTHTWPCEAGREVLLYTIGGGGHTWPGHKNWYPAFVVGPAAPEPDATRLIWNFFKAHRRRGE